MKLQNEGFTLDCGEGTNDFQVYYDDNCALRLADSGEEISEAACTCIQGDDYEWNQDVNDCFIITCGSELVMDNAPETQATLITSEDHRIQTITCNEGYTGQATWECTSEGWQEAPWLGCTTVPCCVPTCDTLKTQYMDNSCHTTCSSDNTCSSIHQTYAQSCGTCS